MQVYWIWLALLRDISLRQKHALLERFRDPEALYRAAAEEVPEAVREALQNKDLSPAKKILSRCREQGIRVIALTDSAYPTRLRYIPDPPLVLYCLGKLPGWEDMPVIGVVGTRKASPYGCTTAYSMGGQLSACGALVVSGLALGIDAEAMRGALAAGGMTVGVLGCGVDIVYPKHNQQLFSQVLEKGCLISEYPPGTQPAPWLFPERNRIISGMSNGVLIVEAPEKSGALITAQDAMEQGRDVFVVPGNIDAPTSAGSNALLRDGAMPAFSGWDVVQQYQGIYPQAVQKRVFDGQKQQVPPAVSEVVQTASREKQNVKQAENNKISIDKGEKSHYSVLNDALSEMTSEEQAIYACLTDAPQPTDEIVDKAGQPAQKVLTVLTRMALKGIVRQHPGKRFSK